MSGQTVSHAEVAKFDALAARWWDPNGPMRPLHRMNPVQLAWIAERLQMQKPPPPPAGGAGGEVALLDIGCGAGIAAEAFARLGFTVTGLDASGAQIEAARAHASLQALPITYRTGMPEDLFGVLGPLSNCSWSVLGQRHGHWRLLEHNAGTLPEPVVLSDDR